MSVSNQSSIKSVRSNKSTLSHSLELKHLDVWQASAPGARLNFHDHHHRRNILESKLLLPLLRRLTCR